MLAEQKKSEEIEQGEALIADGQKCAASLIDKYRGANFSDDLFQRIALEAFVIGRIGKTTVPVDDPRFWFVS